MKIDQNQLKTDKVTNELTNTLHTELSKGKFRIFRKLHLKA